MYTVDDVARMLFGVVCSALECLDNATRALCLDAIARSTRALNRVQSLAMSADLDRINRAMAAQ